VDEDAWGCGVVVALVSAERERKARPGSRRITAEKKRGESEAAVKKATGIFTLSLSLWSG
jgi:hypothetical protein